MTTLRHSPGMAGFTLIEAIMVIVITAVLGALVVSFVNPLKGYFDATRRADLGDVADTTLRRMARELHTALPNSVRVNGNFVEFLPTLSGGRYRAVQDCSAACTGDALIFTGPDTGFDVIGALSAAPVVGNEVVVYNLGVAGDDVYAGDNVASIAFGSTTGNVKFSSKQFPFESPSNRFQIIGGPVTYACDVTTFWRYSGYARQPGQPTSISTLDGLAGVTKSRLATGVDCASSNITYTSGVTQRSGLIAMRLKMTNASGESVILQHQVHVDNVP